LELDFLQLNNEQAGLRKFFWGKGKEKRKRKNTYTLFLPLPFYLSHIEKGCWTYIGFLIPNVKDFFQSFSDMEYKLRIICTPKAFLHKSSWEGKGVDVKTQQERVFWCDRLCCTLTAGEHRNLHMSQNSELYTKNVNFTT
jgi:hypothetical protein